MTDHVLGIDLGTTNSVVSIVQGNKVQVLRDADGNELIPSVVSFHEKGDILVGSLARDRRLIDAKNTIYSIKRLIGRPYDSDELRQAQARVPFVLAEGPHASIRVEARGSTYALQEISAFVLAHIRTLAEQSLGSRVNRCVITVPANFNELQRSATKAAGQVAGLKVLRIINEPTAAALAYGQDRQGSERVAVYDLGGGTFDITILELAGDVFEVVATAGDSFLGGDDVDSLLADQFAAAFAEQHKTDPSQNAQALERIRAAAEWAKCKLSEDDSAKVHLADLVYDDNGLPIDMDFNLARKHMEGAIRPLLERSFDVCERAMAIAQIRPTHLDNVILVGGSTRMKLVRAMVADYFGREPLTNIDADLVVAQGAAIHAASLAGLDLQDVVVAPPSTVKRAKLEEMQRERAAQEEKPKGPAFAPKEQRYVPPPPPMFGAAAPEPQAAPVPPPLRHSHAPGPIPPLPAPSRPPTGEFQMPPALGAPSLLPLESLELVDVSAPPPLPPLIAAPMVSIGEAPPSLPAPIELGPVDDHEPPAPIEENTLLVPDGPPPLLLDVTPHSLGVETVGGYCEHVIERNAAIPIEQSRVFATAQAKQEAAVVRICQGESRKMDENQPLGEFVIEGLGAGKGGMAQIVVTFVIDSDGTLHAKATDAGTGQEKGIKIRLIGGVDEAEVAEMQDRHAEAFGG